MKALSTSIATLALSAATLVSAHPQVSRIHYADFKIPSYSNKVFQLGTVDGKKTGMFRGPHYRLTCIVTTAETDAAKLYIGHDASANPVQYSSAKVNHTTCKTGNMIYVKNNDTLILNNVSANQSDSAPINDMRLNMINLNDAYTLHLNCIADPT